MQYSVCIEAEAMMTTIEVMRRQEEVAYRAFDYLHQQSPQFPTVNVPQNLCGVDVDCRFRMSEWCYQIVDFCKFKRETVAISMSFLDRFLSSPAGQEVLNDRSKFQLAAMTCLYTAVKIHEPEAMEPGLIASLSRGAFDREQVEDMECQILKGIQWRVNPPTAIAFVYQLLELIPSHILSREARSAVLDLAKFQTELAVSDYDFVTVYASTTAFASLLNAFESMQMDINLYANLEQGLAKAAKIDCESKRIRDIRIRLYEAITKQPGSGQLFSSLTPETACLTDYTKAETSVYESPRSVVNA